MKFNTIVLSLGAFCTISLAAPIDVKVRLSFSKLPARRMLTVCCSFSRSPVLLVWQSPSLATTA
ncbi:uncharacterized protein RCC_03897 [Ramularia collo-cygni]|uniref:Uncharacterized protein n=1 Tax=Ramularia collo-cygni TaxID=112498 RepID=A0A2D3V975_9PEZI|nr:uncharacterized protein RCC_03897 [Ramularia collo-cygni]CZT18059.1 uncharacterized protein RCC_03897 [Ramularia collo-cygni]